MKSINYYFGTLGKELNSSGLKNSVLGKLISDTASSCKILLFSVIVSRSVSGFLDYPTDKLTEEPRQGFEFILCVKLSKEKCKVLENSPPSPMHCY